MKITKGLEIALSKEARYRTAGGQNAIFFETFTDPTLLNDLKNVHVVVILDAGNLDEIQAEKISNWASRKDKQVGLIFGATFISDIRSPEVIAFFQPFSPISLLHSDFHECENKSALVTYSNSSHPILADLKSTSNLGSLTFKQPLYSSKVLPKANNLASIQKTEAYNCQGTVLAACTFETYLFIISNENNRVFKFF